MAQIRGLGGTLRGAIITSRDVLGEHREKSTISQAELGQGKNYGGKKNARKKAGHGMDTQKGGHVEGRKGEISPPGRFPP